MRSLALRTRSLGAALAVVAATSFVVGTAAPASATATPPGQTSLAFVSDPGDSIGGGQTRSWSPADGTFSTTHGNGLVEVRFTECLGVVDARLRGADRARHRPGTVRGRHPLPVPVADEAPG